MCAGELCLSEKSCLVLQGDKCVGAGFRLTFLLSNFFYFCFDLNGFPFALVFGACCAVEMPRVEMPFSKTPSI